MKPGEILRDLREKMGMTDYELNVRCGFEEGYISELEIGFREPTPAAFTEIGQWLGIDGTLLLLFYIPPDSEIVRHIHRWAAEQIERSHKPMMRQKHDGMAWRPQTRQWQKTYRRKVYCISCKQLGVPGNRADSVIAAQTWWANKKEEIDREHRSTYNFLTPSSSLGPEGSRRPHASQQDNPL